jgi:hypothetical protein
VIHVYERFGIFQSNVKKDQMFLTPFQFELDKSTSYISLSFVLFLEGSRKWGAGKTTYTFSANANVLSANFQFSVLPAGREGVGQVAETESTLVLAENVYVNLPTP